MIRNESDVKIDSSTFWTDSTCLLGYLSNTSKRFKTFVANRVVTIRYISSSSEWRYVDSTQNPVDDASRGLSAEALVKNQRWLTGPEFLWKPEEFWSRLTDAPPSVDDNDPEVKTSVQNFAVVQGPSRFIMDRIMERYSSWMQLKKCIAWLLRLRRNLRRKSNRDEGTIIKPAPTKTVKPLSVEELKQGEKEIVKFVQRSFQEEIDSLTCLEALNTVAKPAIKKTSVIYKLDPEMIDGVLCVGGRLANAPIAEENKHPVIIPKDSGISYLIARHFHHIAGHSG